jgi:hypothetical protein
VIHLLIDNYQMVHAHVCLVTTKQILHLVRHAIFHAKNALVLELMNVQAAKLIRPLIERSKVHPVHAKKDSIILVIKKHVGHAIILVNHVAVPLLINVRAVQIIPTIIESTIQQVINVFVMINITIMKQIFNAQVVI